MQANVKWVEGNTYIGRSNSNHNVVFDAGSDGAAPSPMEMVLMSVGGCSSVDVVSILKKTKQDFFRRRLICNRHLCKMLIEEQTWLSRK